ncbi:MAG: cell division ATPase MinD [Nanoarchaeota archaeon]|nr:cell division ATPase MinD [Nanoarchaeota archaeon]
MSKIILVTSGKGGVGKTTTSINLGAALNAYGDDVIVVDANLTTPNVGIHFGVPIVPVNLNHVLNGKAEIDEAVYEHESGIKIIPSSLSIKELDNIKTKKMPDVAKRLRKLADYIIFDSGAGLGTEVTDVMDAVDDVIIVTNPDMPSVTDALKAAKVAEQKKKNILGAIVTKAIGASTEMSIKSIEEMLEIPILGVIPDDSKVKKALMIKDAVVHTHPSSKAARAYKNIAAGISGRKPGKKVDYRKGFWGKLSEVFSS